MKLTLKEMFSNEAKLARYIQTNKDAQKISERYLGHDLTHELMACHQMLLDKRQELYDNHKRKVQIEGLINRTITKHRKDFLTLYDRIPEENKSEEIKESIDKVIKDKKVAQLLSYVAEHFHTDMYLNVKNIPEKAVGDMLLVVKEFNDIEECEIEEEKLYDFIMHDYEKIINSVLKGNNTNLKMTRLEAFSKAEDDYNESMKNTDENYNKDVHRDNNFAEAFILGTIIEVIYRNDNKTNHNFDMK